MRASTFLLSLVCACGSSSTPETVAPSRGEYGAGVAGGAPTAGTGDNPAGLTEIRGDLAPVPFPPGSLARSLGAGATITYRIEPDGEEPFFQSTEFVEVDEEGATMRDTQTELDGTPRGEPRTARLRWTELESHAHFPRSATTITAEAIEVPAGLFAGYRYEIRGTADGAATTTRLWFARELPGPPVKVIREADGRTVLEMTLVASERPVARSDDDRAPAR